MVNQKQIIVGKTGKARQARSRTYSGYHPNSKEMEMLPGFRMALLSLSTKFGLKVVRTAHGKVLAAQDVNLSRNDNQESNVISKAPALPGAVLTVLDADKVRSHLGEIWEEHWSKRLVATSWLP
ncbi:hypothetical protein E4U54_008269 [Claviceps lovelessii]|nr:hypothetical protein E4U54_008269 [Claviceps lovelessii]